MSGTTGGRRRTPPPIVNDNPVAPPPLRSVPPEPSPPVASPAVTEDAPGGELLANLLANNEGETGSGSGSGSGSSVRDLMTILAQSRQRVIDPMTDWVSDGTRMPWFVRDAIEQQALVLNESQQKVKRDALIGVRPLEPAILDSCYLARYGKRRPQ